jgi:hypothetical protein
VHLLCDVSQWQDPSSPVWCPLVGSQDEIGQRIAAMIHANNTDRLDDFGGVAAFALCDGRTYRTAPPRMRQGGAIFSFTPKKQLLSEGEEMARAAASAGYGWMLIMLTKHGKFGKVWILESILRADPDLRLEYFEDSNGVIDEIKSLDVGERLKAIHVQVPGYEYCVAKHADRRVTQSEYVAEDCDE